jgi:nucleotide-binding universal stress UspA family protein
MFFRFVRRLVFEHYVSPASPVGIGQVMKILIAVDSSETAHEAALAAKRLFPHDEHLILSAAAITPFLLSEPIGGGAFVGIPTLDALSSAEHDADDAVASAKRTLGETSTTTIEIGDPGRVICEQAAELRADVVVIGHRSKRWLSRLFDPSVSDYVVRHSPCPVLVVREHGE